MKEVEYYATENGWSPIFVFDMLEDDFSAAMLEYALEHCNADWRGNTLLQVEKPPFTTYSYKKIINELMRYGYTEEDATFAADNCNADWNERCCRLVKSYLEDDATYNDERDWLTRDLKDYGLFTDEEIAYALDQCGVK